MNSALTTVIKISFFFSIKRVFFVYKSKNKKFFYIAEWKESEGDREGEKMQQQISICA